MADATLHFDALASALYDGPVKAVDIKCMPGSNAKAGREAVSAELFASMTRLGIIVDGKLAGLKSH